MPTWQTDRAPLNIPMRVWMALAVWPFLFLGLGPAQANAISPLELRTGQTSYSLTSYMEILENADPSWTLDDVSSGRQSDRFRPVGKDRVNIKYTNQVNWFRFSITGVQAETGWLLTSDYPFFFDLALYGPIPPEPTSETSSFSTLVSTGLDHRFSDASFNYRLPVLPIRPADGVYYLRTVTHSMTPIQFRIVDTTSFAGEALSQRMVFGICIGILLCMLLYNLFICVSLRSSTYLYYVLYIFCLLTTSLFLYGYLGELLHIPGDLYMRLMWVFAGGFTLWAMTFIRSFLSTRENAPIMDKIVVAAIIYGVVMSLLGAFGMTRTAWYLGFFSSIASPFIGLTAGIASLKSGVRGAKYFLLAWGVFIAAILVASLDFVRLLPNWPFPKQSLLIGSAFESTLLSLALADRIRALREDKLLLQKQERHLQHLSQTDGLTGLYNKRYFLDRLVAETGWDPSDQPLCMVMMDVDNFKKFNDTYGHLAGDRVLSELAATMKENVRDNDVCCRFGGEEFAVIMPRTNVEHAYQATERIRKAFADRVIEFEGQSLRAAISLGLAALKPGENVKDLINRADQALYQAKRQGKNQTVAAE